VLPAPMYMETLPPHSSGVWDFVQALFMVFCVWKCVNCVFLKEN